MKDRTTHELKIWPEYFDAIWFGQKTFEVRKNDRGFKVEDLLVLLEWLPSKAEYTGRRMTVRVHYILQGGQFGIEPGYVVMGVK